MDLVTIVAKYSEGAGGGTRVHNLSSPPQVFNGIGIYGSNSIDGGSGGGGGGANSTRDGGAPSYGGESYVNIVDYSGTVITSYTLTPPAAVSGQVNGSSGTIKITDGNGTATYTSGSGTHVVA